MFAGIQGGAITHSVDSDAVFSALLQLNSYGSMTSGTSSLIFMLIIQYRCTSFTLGGGAFG